MTWYSASLSWAHFHDLIGPIAAVSAAILLFLAGHRDGGGWMRCIVLGALGLVAAGISGAVVYKRVNATEAGQAQVVANANLPGVEAQKALDDAKAALKSAGDEAKAECLTGRKRRCLELEKREDDARQRVADARKDVVKAGAASAGHPEVLAQVLPFALPIWLEIAAPVLIGYGLAPSPRKPQAPLQCKPECKPTERLQRKAGRKPSRKRGASHRHGTRAYWLERLDRDRPDLLVSATA
jgi:hypothetical protein